MEQGWDTDVKKFLTKILNSISVVLIWMITFATAGIYFQLGYVYGKPVWQPVLFYTVMLVALLLLIRYLHKNWSGV